MPRFAVLLYLGSSKRELSGAQDLLESLFVYEPRVNEIVIVDDGGYGEKLRQTLPVPHGIKLTLLSNPRQGKGDGWLGGTSAAMTAGFQYLSTNRAIDFVLKVDTDSLVIAPFSKKVVDAFRANPEVGALGSHTIKPYSGQEMDRPTAIAIKKLLRPFTIWRRIPGSSWPAVQIGTIGRYGRIRHMLHQALAHQYNPGEMCQGGGFAVSAPALAAMNRMGLLSDPLLWMKTPCADDVVLAIYVRAAGYSMQNFCGKDEPFGVKYKGLPAPPQVMLDYGFSIIHSVKDFGEYQEAETRAFFRQVRQNQLAYIVD